MAANHLHPVPTPPNNQMSARDRFYEWLLSDHPAAAHERARRRLNHHLHEAQELHRLRAWASRIDQHLAAGEPVDDPILDLHELATRRLIPNAQQRLTESIERADSPEARDRDRQAFEYDRQAEDPDYRYPDRYRGPAAADHPIPPDPGRRPHDPALHAEHGERTTEGLLAETHPSAWMRALAITDRAKDANDRALASPRVPGWPRPGAPKRTPLRIPRTRTGGRALDDGGRSR